MQYTRSDDIMRIVFLIVIVSITASVAGPSKAILWHKSETDDAFSRVQWFRRACFAFAGNEVRKHIDSKNKYYMEKPVY